jgi:DNA mismatch repair protein MutS
VEPEDSASTTPADAGDDLRAALAALDPDALSPREALEQLYQLKRLAA